MNYVVMFLWAWGSPWLAKFYGDLADHLRNAMSSGTCPSSAQRHRLLWLNLRPYYKTGLPNYLETELRASVAFEEYSWPYWNRLDPDDPFTQVWSTGWDWRGLNFLWGLLIGGRRHQVGV